MKMIKVTIMDFVSESGKMTPVKKVFPVTIPYSEECEKWAKKRSIDGNVEIYEIEDPAPAVSQLDIIEAQVTYTAMMTDTLLEV